MLLLKWFSISSFLLYERRERINEDDLLLGMALFEWVWKTTVTGLPQSVLDFYTQVVVHMEEDVTYHSMIAAYKHVYKRTVSRYI
jgi:hypothetical protein